MKKIIIALSIITLSLYSCDKWLDVEPTDRQVESKLFKTRAGFFAAVNGVYEYMGSDDLYGKRLSFEFLEIMTQRYKINTTNTETIRNMATQNYAYEGTLNAIDDIWKSAYLAIMNANKILYNLDVQQEILTAEEAKILKGEMLTARAFIHFDMFRLFAPLYDENSTTVSIPYNKNYHVKTEDRLLPKDLFENYILKDIEEAESLLLSDVVKTEGANVIPATDLGEIVVENIKHYRQLRLNYFALHALKARVYLWMGKKEKAVESATKVLSEAKTLFPAVDPSTLLGNTTDPDRIFSTEVLFAVYNKKRHLIYDDYCDNEKSKSELLQPKDKYVENTLFKDMMGDYRFLSQWGRTASSSNQGYTLIKYKKLNLDEDKQPFFAQVLPIIRLSEMYLIIAECEAKNDKLNDLRATRGSIALSGAYSQNELINEYLREFYGEGQSFFVFKRLKQNITGADFNANGSSTYGFVSRSVLPLPESETLPR